MVIRILLVGAGGAVGAICRYGISLIPIRGAFPFPTLLTNLLGAVVIGFVVGVIPAAGSGENQLLFWKTGVCGGFTTFSTFSLEAFRLLENGRVLLAAVYVLSSVVLCLLGVWLGLFLGGRLTTA